ncbi:hypothetical protein V8C86DRAFT_463958 [Haematococcus lacustris]
MVSRHNCSLTPNARVKLPERPALPAIETIRITFRNVSLLSLPTTFPGCAATNEGLPRAASSQQPAARLPRSGLVFPARSRPARRARPTRVHGHPSFPGSHPWPKLLEFVLAPVPRTAWRRREHQAKPSEAIAAVLAEHPDIRARLEAIPRYLSDTNMVDHVGQQLQTAFSTCSRCPLVADSRSQCPWPGQRSWWALTSTNADLGWGGWVMSTCKRGLSESAPMCAAWCAAWASASCCRRVGWS